MGEEEAVFFEERKKFIVSSGALKRFLKLDDKEEIHPDDVPIIGFGGSGQCKDSRPKDVLSCLLDLTHCFSFSLILTLSFLTPFKIHRRRI